MPLYTIITQEDALASAEKAALARRITDIHVEQSGVPSNWVHVVFQTYSVGNGFTAGAAAATVALTVIIRTGRPPEYKRELLTKLWHALQHSTRAPDDQIALAIHEVPASQAMEMGKIMPDV